MLKETINSNDGYEQPLDISGVLENACFVTD